ncbi:MAG: hypothetical protein ACNI25_01450 [Halarcobacter sp.]
MAEKSDEDIIKEVGLDNDKQSVDGTTNVEEENQEKVEENTQEPILEEIELPQQEENTTGDEKVNKKIQKRQPKILRIMITVIAILFSLLAIGLMLYFLGFFTPDEDPKEITKTQASANEQRKNQIDININELDEKKLNKKLTTLTKHEIMNKHELEAEEKRIKEEEEKRIAAEKKAQEDKKKKMQEEIDAQYAKIDEEKKLLSEQQKQIKEEQEKFLALQKQLKDELEIKKTELLQELDTKKSMENTPSGKVVNNQEANIPQEQTNNEVMQSSNQFLSFINVATIKGELLKSYLDKLLTFEKNVSLCRDPKNRIVIYFGPYGTDGERKKVYDELMNNGYKQAYLSDLTNEEYEKRCKY